MDPIPAPISPTAPYLTLNPHHFPITTSSPAAQEWFNRALNLTYAFSHEEALVCFYQVLAHDEACLMGYWGVAYALGANYNKTWELYAKGEVEKTVPHIRAALDQVKRRNLRGTEQEQSLVHALDARMPQDLTNRDYSTWNTKYAHAMRDVYTRFPENIDVAAIFAESLMVLTPWRLWDLTTGLPTANSHAAEIKQILESAMRTDKGRRHPGLLHFYIHLMEMSSTPELALPAANALPSLVPDAGHLQHMPSHIYFLIGDYARAIDANLRGIAADETYMRITGRSGGFYLVYRLHNMQFVVYAAMFAGQYELAMEHVEMIERNVPLDLVHTLGDFIEATYAIRLQVYVRFGKWDLLKHLPIPEDRQLFPITTAFTYWARAIAFSATRDVGAAETERERYLDAVEMVPEGRLMFPNTARQVHAIGTSFLDGELEYRKGEYDTAFTHLEESIKRYDGLVYCEPWSWMTPPRHAYAALSLEQGHTTRALETYYADLGFNDNLARAHQHPNNIWALAGAEDCLRLLGREDERRIVEVLLRTGRAVADVQVGVSCFCRIDRLPGGEAVVVDVSLQQGAKDQVDDGKVDQGNGCCQK
ncbi:hypothetical protein QFC20_006011 [Naganishia adeliensis]|uniref:Uncharacterized protein n=1 Tax=Naganishia adeliensis TaxID=92952 RepID=A0ACC2VGU2_9TREE|nr:hypothetical protein QFC20_006011 [Naganishia adeliensis]